MRLFWIPLLLIAFYSNAQSDCFKFDKKDEFTGVQTTYTNEVIVIHESAFKLFEDADECTIKMGLCCQNN
ncbi:MAG: hypothetical protein NTX03_15555, partial [Bacteroidetes bacterium]|nr:hypothetical protein [Bacteroidota bacterium]